MNYDKFFTSINYLLSISNEKDRQASIRGENYNIFEIIGLTTDEVKLHSSFIADLLSPQGLHGLGVKPLKRFVELLQLQFSPEDLSKAEIIKEYHIGTISEDYNWGGNIDILIKIKDFVLAIENKINAGDQPKQLFRYYSFIKSKPHTLLYLTLDGHDASKSSSCGLKSNVDYKCISYGIDIYKWLNEILMLSISRPLVRETVQQYLNVIRKLTKQDMEEVDRTELFKAMDKNPNVVREIVDTQWAYRQYLVDTYIIEPLKDYFKAKGFVWYENENFQNQSSGASFGIYLPGWKRIICIAFEKQNYGDGFSGIWNTQKVDDASFLSGNINFHMALQRESMDKYKSWNISIAEDIISGKVYRCVVEIFEDWHKRICENPELYQMN